MSVPLSYLQAHQPPQAFRWRWGRDMLFGTCWACAVVLNGNVYVGGGDTARDEDDFIIQVYSPESDGWRRLPQCPVRFFAMAAVNQQLVVVGGGSHNHQVQSTVLVWDDTSRCWTTTYPNMPTARCEAAAVSYQQFLVVAGGYGQSDRDLNTVNILNSSTKQWVTAAPLPTACCQLSPALVGDTLYLLGGFADHTPSKQMFSTSISALISHATSSFRAPPPNWDVTDTKLTHSKAVSLNNSLLAVGGRDDGSKDSSAIYHYNPLSKRWTKVGDVPSALSRCSCTALPSGELTVLGGYAGYRRVVGVHIAKVD